MERKEYVRLENTSGSIWNNEKKEAENHPDFSGLFHIGFDDLDLLIAACNEAPEGCDSVACFASGWNNVREYRGEVSSSIGIKFTIAPNQRPRKKSGNYGGYSGSEDGGSTFE